MCHIWTHFHLSSHCLWGIYSNPVCSWCPHHLGAAGALWSNQIPNSFPDHGLWLSFLLSRGCSASRFPGGCLFLFACLFFILFIYTEIVPVTLPRIGTFSVLSSPTSVPFLSLRRYFSHSVFNSAAFHALHRLCYVHNPTTDTWWKVLKISIGWMVKNMPGKVSDYLQIKLSWVHQLLD